MRSWIGFVIAMLVAVLLAVVATTPPRPVVSASDPAKFSAARAMDHVRRIAVRPHPTGSSENAKVRAYLVAQLEGLGFTVEESRAPLSEVAARRLATWSGDSGTSPQLTNIVARRPGKDPSLPAVALMAHHDTVWGSPGAGDDTAGLAAILEAVRALDVAGPARRDTYVIFTDAEELGLDGARAFFGTDPRAARIGAVINLEIRGAGGIATLFQLSPGNAQAARLYADVAPHPSTTSLAVFLYSILPNDTDLTVPLERGGYVAYNIASIGRAGLYHSPLATPNRLDQGALQQMGGQTLALTRALADAKTLPTRTGDAVFFDLFGVAVAIYPPWLGWVMLVLAIGGFVLARTRAEAEGSAWSGAWRMSALLVAPAVLLFAFNWISGADGNYYDRLAAIPQLTAMALATCLATWLALFGGSAWPPRARIGAAVPLVFLAFVGQALAPTAAYPVVIAVMIAGAVEGVHVLRGWRAGRIAAMVGAGLGTGYLLAQGFTVMQGVGPDLPYVAALPAALAMLLWLPLWPGFGRSRTAAMILAAFALVMAMWVRLDPVPPTVAVYADVKRG